VPALWLVESPDKGQLLMETPIFPDEGQTPGECKHLLTQRLRSFFRDNGVTRFANAMEAWTLLDGLKPEEPVPTSIANHPKRREAVVLNAEDHTRSLFALREIVRPEHGKPYLLKLKIERQELMEGRFVGMLSGPEHVRCSSELDPDEGTVFVTNVADAPFQILGRRDPMTGELCVGSTFRSRKGGGHATFDEQEIEEMQRELGSVEIVADEEARQLIDRVARKQRQQN
jgi:hypothetical protein